MLIRENHPYIFDELYGRRVPHHYTLTPQTAETLRVRREELARNLNLDRVRAQGGDFNHPILDTDGFPDWRLPCHNWSFQQVLKWPSGAPCRNPMELEKAANWLHEVTGKHAVEAALDCWEWLRIGDTLHRYDDASRRRRKR